MNDSFLYHMYGIRDMHYCGTTYKGHSAIITLEPKENHFHVVKLMNDALDKVRRDAYRNIEDEDVRKAIKGTRWMLLSNSEDLKGREKLAAALRLNRPLFDAYYLKEVCVRSG